MEESRCGYHSKVCTQVVSTACLFEILVSYHFYTVLLENGVSNKGIPKARISLSPRSLSLSLSNLYCL